MTTGERTALAQAAGLLRCPACGAAVTVAAGAVRCTAGHSFDVARQGYVNLLPGNARPGTADTAGMVDARAAFLAAGHYAPIAEVAADAAEAAAREDGAVVDLGAGTGYYLAETLRRLPERLGVALDLSKHAAKRAAVAHPRVAAVVSDAWQALPLRDSVAAVVLNVFAPRNAAEIARVLAPGGAVVVVTPTQRHLRELVTELGLVSVDERKPERLEKQLGAHADRGAEVAVEFVMPLRRENVRALVAMGPSARHLDEATLVRRVEALPEPCAVTASVTVSTYRRS